MNVYNHNQQLKYKIVKEDDKQNAISTAYERCDRKHTPEMLGNYLHQFINNIK